MNTISLLLAFVGLLLWLAATLYMKKPITIALVLAGFVGQVRAQSRIYVNEYLNIGVGSRGLAMAGAQAASVHDVTSAYWNPAGLVLVKDQLQVGLMHAEYFSGNAKYDYGSVVKPLQDGKRVVAFSALRFAVDDIPNTIDYIQPDGSFDESKLKSLTAGDYAFLLSYAQKIRLFKDSTIQTRIGTNAKVIYRHLGSLANAWGAGVDIGVQTTWHGWMFGITAKDVTTTYTSWSFNLSERDKQVFGQTGNEIPVKSYEVMNPRINIGIARQLLPQKSKIQALAELGADVTTDGKRNTVWSNNTFALDPRLGLEVSYKGAVYLRAGVGNFQRVLDDADTSNQKKILMYQPSLGIGLNLKFARIDYAFTSLQTQANPLYTHVVSLVLAFNKQVKTDVSATPKQ